MKTTALTGLHRELGAKMVPFAGYDMPVQYPQGIIKEHLHTRAAAGLFDVSHMGQVVITGAGAAQALEALLPVDLLSLPQHSQTYALLTNDEGGVRDDLIITRWDEEQFFLVINAACKEQDIAYLRAHLPGLELIELPDQALLALQGPLARQVMRELAPAAADLRFMNACRTSIDDVEAYITCSGYTGEDGFEISVESPHAEAIARKLLSRDQVEAIGLGARDSLRLEAGLCLYGHELDTQTSPVTACLMWSISAARRETGARAGGFPGAQAIFQQAREGARRKRVGLRVTGKRPVRDGQVVVDTAGAQVGVVTSACYGASVEQPLAMATVDTAQAQAGTELAVDVRGKLVPVTVSKTPFVPQRYFRG